MQPRRYHHGGLRAALLAAAEAELAERGIEGFTLRGAAKRAGVSHAAPAHHFADTRALLTALAAEGFDRLVAAQARREAAAPPGEPARLIAAGLGYVDFALAHPALFRLIFASDRPDRDAPPLREAAAAAWSRLLAHVAALRGLAGDPEASPAAMADATAAWGIVHGIADLMQHGRMPWLADLPPAARDAALAPILARALFPAPGTPAAAPA